MEILERDEHLKMLAHAWSEAETGSGRLVLVSGEAGVGKTTLLQRFAQEARGSILWGSCDAAFTPRPLSPCYDLARQGLPGMLPLLQSGADWLAAASAVLSGIEAADSLTAIVFEDVHWADDASLDLIKYLGRRIQSTKTLLILTYRDDELGSQHKLKIVLGDLATSTAVTRIRLAPLSSESVRELAKTAAGQGAPVDPVRLYQQTNGNPFFVTEVLAAGGEEIPATVRDAVLARAGRVSRSGRAVLDAAAVIGPRVEPWLLSALTHSEVAAVEECLAAGILQTQGDWLAFRHELARQTLLDEISQPRQRMLHRHTLDALEASPVGREDLARLAHHAEGADDAEAVLRYAPEAGRQAGTAHAHREAAAQYARALRFAQHLPAHEQALLLEAYADECLMIDQNAEGIAARRAALAIWQTMGNRLKQGENLAEMMPHYFRLGHNSEAEQVSREAIEVLQALPPSRELALAYQVQAHLRMFHRDQQESIRWGEQAIALAETVHDPAIVASSYNAIGSAWIVTDFQRGQAYLEKSRDLARQAGLASIIGNYFSNAGSAAGEVYHYIEADRILAEGLAYAAERDLDSHRNYIQAWQALSALHLGRWSEAGDLARRLLERPGISQISRIMALLALGRLRARRGDPGVWEALDEALALAEQTQAIQRVAPARAMRAEAAWLSGDYRRAIDEAKAAYDSALSKRHPWFTGELALWRRLAGDDVRPPEWTAKPFALALAGDWQGAAAAWEALGCVYERALALSEGDTPARLAALETFERIGAQPAAERLRHKLHLEGAKGIPRGPQIATRGDPFSLTRREREVLGLLVEGLSNPDISRRLHLSTRTVEHHVSAILSKLGVHTRSEAITLAHKHDPQASNPT